MPILTNPRREKFAQGLFEGRPASEAYEKAGYRPNRANATRLKANDHIRARLDELHKAVIEDAGVTIEGHLAKLADLRDRAEADGSWGAATRAEELRGKASGFYVNHLKIEDKVSDRELITQARGLGTAQGHALADLLEASSPDYDEPRSNGGG